MKRFLSMLLIAVMMVAYVPHKAFSAGEGGEFKLSDYFGKVQGEGNFYYQYEDSSAFLDMSYDGAGRWMAPNPACLIGNGFYHPGNNVFPAVVWIAPEDGMVSLSSEKVIKVIDESTNGTNLTISLNSTQIHKIEIRAKETYDLNINTKVKKGDKIYFKLDANGAAVYDDTTFSPVVTYVTTGDTLDLTIKDTVGTKWQTASSLLTALGILDVSDNGNVLGINKPVTRGEFAIMLAKSIKATPVGGYSYFNDIEINDELCPYLNTLAELSIISAGGDFKKDDYITGAQVAKMTVCAIGHNITAASFGGWPMGYMLTAKDKNIFRDMEILENDCIIYGEMVTILFNMMNAPLLLADGTPKSYTLEENKDVTILTNNFKVYKDVGVVVAVGSKGIVKSNLDENSIMIGQTRYGVGNTKCEEQIGHTVEYYYKYISGDSDQKELVYAYDKPRKNNVITVVAENILDVSDNMRNLKYREYSDGKFTDIKVELTEGVSCMLNGAVYNDVKSEDLMPNIKDIKTGFQSGTLALIDNNNDEIYDVIILKSYATALVNAVSTDGILSDVLTGEKFDISSENGEIVEIMRDGKEIKPNTIKMNEVASIAISKNKVGKIVKHIDISTNVISGKVWSISEDMVEIEGNSYSLSNYNKYLQEKGKVNKLKALDTGNFYLDIEGNIVFFEAMEIKNYGYVVNGAIEKGLIGKSKLELFTMDGEWKTFELCDNVAFKNGNTPNIEEKKYSAKYAIESMTKNGKLQRQLILYETDTKGQIKKIHTAQKDLGAKKSKIGSSDFVQFQSKYRTNDKGEFIKEGNNYTANYQVFKAGVRGILSYGSYNINAYIREDAKIININERYADKKTSYEKGDIKNFYNDGEHIFEIYNMDKYYNVPVIINYTSIDVTGGASEENEDEEDKTIVSITKETDPLKIVSKFSEGINEDGEKQGILECYEGGVKAKYVYPDTVNVKQAKLKRGDIIRFNQTDGTIEQVERFNSTTPKTSGSATYYSDRSRCSLPFETFIKPRLKTVAGPDVALGKPSGTMSAIPQIVAGDVTETRGNLVIIDSKYEETPVFIPTKITTSTSVTIVTVEKGEVKEVNRGRYSDISVGDYIVTANNQGGYFDAIVYKLPYEAPPVDPEKPPVDPENPPVDPETPPTEPGIVKLKNKIHNSSTNVKFYTYPENDLGAQTEAYKDIVTTGVENSPSIVAGEGDNPENHTIVKVFNKYQALKTQFLAYATTVKGGVQVATIEDDVTKSPLIVTAPYTADAKDIRVFTTSGSKVFSFIPTNITPPYAIATGNFVDGKPAIAVTSLNGGSDIKFYNQRGTLLCSAEKVLPTEKITLSRKFSGATDTLIAFSNTTQTVFEIDGTAIAGERKISGATDIKGVYQSAFGGYIGSKAENKMSNVYLINEQMQATLKDVGKKENMFWINTIPYTGDKNTYVDGGKFNHYRVEYNNNYFMNMTKPEQMKETNYGIWANGIDKDGIKKAYNSDVQWWEPTFTHRMHIDSPVIKMLAKQKDDAGLSKYFSLTRANHEGWYKEGEVMFKPMTYAPNVPEIERVFTWSLRESLSTLAEQYRGESGDPSKIIGLSPIHEQEIYISNWWDVGDYNAANVKGFSEYLKTLYTSINELNTYCGTSFKSFEEVDPPRFNPNYNGALNGAPPDIYGDSPDSSHSKSRGVWDNYGYDNPYYVLWVQYNSTIVNMWILRSYREALMAGFPPEMIHSHSVASAEEAHGNTINNDYRIAPLDGPYSAGVGLGTTKYNSFYKNPTNVIANGRNSGFTNMVVGEYSMIGSNAQEEANQMKYMFDNGVSFIHEMYENNYGQSADSANAIKNSGEPRTATTGGTGNAVAVKTPKGKLYNIVQLGTDVSKVGLLKSLDANGEFEGSVYLSPFHAKIDVEAFAEGENGSLNSGEKKHFGKMVNMTQNDQIELRFNAKSATVGTKLKVTFFRNGSEIPNTAEVFNLTSTSQEYLYIFRNQLVYGDVQVRIEAINGNAEYSDLSCIAHWEIMKNWYGNKVGKSYKGGVSFDILDNSYRNSI